MTKPDDPVDPARVRLELERILDSPDFHASPRNRRFLAYLVEETLGGRGAGIKAYAIATAVFGRAPAFDPQQDPIVRVEAGRLRSALEHYYLTAGRSDPIRIGLPKGDYAATFEVQSGDLAKGDPAPSRATDASERTPRGPAILVTAFEPAGRTARCRDFTWGLTRKTAVALTQFTDLRVFGPEFPAARGLMPPGPTSENKLDVDFLVSGAVTLSGARCEVDVVLSDAQSGQNLWARTFDHHLNPGQSSAGWDEVANEVARALAQPYGVIFSTISRESNLAASDSARSDDALIRSFEYERAYDRDLFEPTRVALERAIAQDPHYPEALARLSQLYCDAYRFGHDVESPLSDPLARALELARRAVTLAPDSTRARQALALALWFSGEPHAALAELEYAYARNPNDTEVMAELGGRYALLAEWDRAVPLLRESYLRNPAQPGHHRIGLALFHYVWGDYRQALAEARKVNAPDVVYGFLIAAAAAARAGLLPEARAQAREILRIDPNYGDRIWADLQARRLHPPLMRHIIDGARLAGLKCGPGKPRHGGHGGAKAA